MDEFFQFAFTLTMAGGLLVGLVVLLAHGLRAKATVNDIDRMYEAGREPRFMSPSGWAFIVFVMGLLGIAFFWVVHHSNFRDLASDRRVPGR